MSTIRPGSPRYTPNLSAPPARSLASIASNARGTNSRPQEPGNASNSNLYEHKDEVVNKEILYWQRKLGINQTRIILRDAPNPATLTDPQEESPNPTTHTDPQEDSPLQPTSQTLQRTNHRPTNIPEPTPVKNPLPNPVTRFPTNLTCLTNTEQTSNIPQTAPIPNPSLTITTKKTPDIPQTTPTPNPSLTITTKFPFHPPQQTTTTGTTSPTDTPNHLIYTQHAPQPTVHHLKHPPHNNAPLTIPIIEELQTAREPIPNPLPNPVTKFPDSYPKLPAPKPKTNTFYKTHTQPCLGESSSPTQKHPNSLNPQQPTNDQYPQPSLTKFDLKERASRPGLGPARIEDLGLHREFIGLKNPVISTDMPSPPHINTLAITAQEAAVVKERILRETRKITHKPNQLGEAPPIVAQNSSQPASQAYYVELPPDDDDEKNELQLCKVPNKCESLLASGFATGVSLKRSYDNLEDKEEFLIKRRKQQQLQYQYTTSQNTTATMAEEAGLPMPLPRHEYTLLELSRHGSCRDS
ncbi:uncharacterized protein LOC130719341 [Lotus japonicus]|uniref:uncharacterized protein LOC130719341 n=1 Tax=Lotus japonicus TaxID=34305 RepID=UPI002585BD96|nr:uncharacterized protein LOC130719341 [Lotus japonicus]